MGDAPKTREGSQMEMYVGMDVHSKECVYAVEDGEGRHVCEGRVATSYEGLSEMRRRCKLPAGARVALESGEMAFIVAKWLLRLDLEPVVVDAREVRVKAHRPQQKSDRRDAVEMCEGLRCGQYRSIVHIPPKEVQRLRSLLSHRRHLVRTKTREANSAKHVVRSEGLGHLAGTLSSQKSWEELHQSLSFAPDLQDLVVCHYEVWLSAHFQMERLEAAIAELEREHFAESVQRLRQLKGVGAVVAQTTVAVLSDVHRFKSVKQVASYVGLVPCTYQSADRDYQGHITKKGSAELRAMLCEAAHHASRSNHPFHPFFAKIAAKQGYKVAIVAVAHRMLRVMWAMLRKGEDFDPRMLGVEEGPFERVVRKQYRLKPQRAGKVACEARAC